MYAHIPISFQITIIFAWEKLFCQLTLVQILLALINVDLFALIEYTYIFVCVDWEKWKQCIVDLDGLAIQKLAT